MLGKGCCKTPILQILSVDPVISWSKGARCCFELPALTGNLAKSDRLRWLIGLLSGWTNIARRPRTVEDHRCERSSTSRTNSVLLTTDAVGEPDAGSLHRSNHWPEPATCHWWFRAAG